MAEKTAAQIQAKQSDWMIVELNPDVHVKTPLPPQCHSALRAGFAGYSTNPRWNVAKLRAWRLGRQWREALAAEQMVVVDTLLMSREDGERYRREQALMQANEVQNEANQSQGGMWRSLVPWSRKKVVPG